MKRTSPVAHALLWLAGAAVSCTVTSAFAGTITCDILQRKLDRIYLPCGEESLVMPGARFVVACGDDTITSGTIEWSRPGIAVSIPLAEPPTMTACSDKTVFVTIPDIDSSSVIRVLATPGIPGDLMFAFPEPNRPAGPRVVGQTTQGNVIELIEQSTPGIEPVAELSIEFDGDDNNGLRRQTIVEAPFIAALVPNVSRPCNQQGFLTTSAYYRFGDIHLPYLLSGANTQRQDRFDRDDSTDSRLYPFGPELGRGLIGNMPDRPNKIRLSYLHDGLKRTADFFADVFARDRIEVDVVAFDSTADIFIAWLPFQSSLPALCPRVLHGLMNRHQTSDNAAGEALALIGQYLHLAETQKSPEAQAYYLNLVDRGLKEDLGAFPLFRPRLVITPTPRLRNVRTDVDGRVLAPELILLTYPPVVDEVADQ